MPVTRQALYCPDFPHPKTTRLRRSLHTDQATPEVSGFATTCLHDTPFCVLRLKGMCRMLEYINRRGRVCNEQIVRPYPLAASHFCEDLSSPRRKYSLSGSSQRV